MNKFLLTILLTLLSFPAFAGEKDSVYDRIIKTGTLRCGYIPFSYGMIVDPNTKAMSGVNYDITMEIGRLLHLNVEWVEELTWATVATSIQTGRVDALCSGMWIDAQNGRVLGFTQPLYYNTISAYGRADETRFKTLADLNDPAVKIVSRDGGMSGIIAGQDFPKATIVSLPSSISDAEMIEYVATKKADIILHGDDAMMEMMKKNPGKYKPLLGKTRLRVSPTALGLPINDPAFQNLMNNAIAELKASRFITKTLSKYVPEGSWIEAQP